MKNLLNPRWLLLINTLPIIILFSLMIGKYQVVSSLLLKNEISRWHGFGFALLGLALMNLIYTGMLLIRKQKVSPFYGLVALLTYIPYLYLFSYNVEFLMPWRIPNWLMGTEGFLYVGTFLMPTLAYSLFILVHHFTPKGEDHKAGLNFILALLIPFSWYFFLTTILPLWQPVNTQFAEHTIIILIIAGTVLFLFFLIRLIYILSLKRIEAFQKYQLYWKIPITILFPLLGLALNNGHLDLGSFLGSNVFGNFSHFSFYGLALLNGLVLCLPNLDRESYRLGLFIARTATFAYTLYFFLVFLPFLPLSVMAIIAVGLGFLMLTPLALFVIHISELTADYKYLRSRLSSPLLRTIAISALLILPLLVTFNYLNHRRHLHRALDFVYHPNYEQSDDHINKRALAHTLQTISEHKDRGRGFDLGFKTPYLSSYYNWLVLDNLMLSNTKIQQLEKIFFGEGSFHVATTFINNEQVEITDLQTRSEWDAKEQVWRSWVDLEITNQQADSWMAEYATQIELPEACWISDYYLYVGDRKEMGMLTEKKSAMWVFSQIRNENRDPGLLHYISGNKVSFRVFPFADQEVRRTGIEFVHRSPVEIKLDDQLISLGEPGNQAVGMAIPPKGILYLEKREQLELDTLYRKPYYHFLVDVSKIEETDFIRYQQEIQTILQGEGPDQQAAKVSLVGTASQTFSITDDWTSAWQPNSRPEGFNLDRALRKELVAHHHQQSSDYPIFLIMSPTPFQNLIEKDFADLAFTYPEGDDFYFLMPNGNWTRHRMSSSPHKIEEVVNISGIKGKPVLAYPNGQAPSHFFPLGKEIIWAITEDYSAGYDPSLVEKSWAAALTLAANWRWQQLYPERSDEIWRPSVKASFDAHILSPLTALIVVENEAQKAALLKKQSEVMKAKSSLDAGEDAARMSEPSFFLVLLLGGGLFWWDRRKRRNSHLSSKLN
ncbi:MAG: MSEP-CTERM sorting domain-containing protein [Saprospiraceae bacterium]|nr:MSEP-CTERM sorting domain-containing protein [Saprospiraceae bacterium]